MLEARKYVQLMPVENIYTSTMIDSNVDTKLVAPFLRTAQEVNIREVIGEKLYNKLMELADADNLTGSYYNLVKYYIHPALIEWTVYYFYQSMANRITNKGIVNKTDADSTPLDKDMLIWNAQNVKNNAEFFSQRINDALFEHKDEFPERFDCFNTCNEVTPKNPYRRGFIF